MLITEIISAYAQNPYPGLTLKYNGYLDDETKWERCSHIRWHGRPCSIVVSHLTEGGAVWISIHKSIQDSWDQHERVILQDLKANGMSARMSTNTQGEKFCFVPIRSNNPREYAQLARDFAEVMEDWVHKLVEDPNYVPTVAGYKIAKKSEIQERVRQEMNKKGFKAYGKTPAEARSAMEKIVNNLDGLQLSMVDLEPYIHNI